MTAQFTDSVKFEGRWFALTCEPLGPWLKRRKNKSLRFKPTSTACWRGYASEWQFHRGRLYLTRLSGTLKDGSVATLDSLLVNYSAQYLDSVGARHPDNAGPGAFAFWVTGLLSCRFGKLLKYEHMGYASITEGELYLAVKDGFLVGSRIVHRERLPWTDDFDIEADLLEIDEPGGVTDP